VSATARTPRALVVRGGWEGHEPKETSDLVIGWLREDGFEVAVEETLAVYADSTTMAEVDLVVQCWTMGHLEPAELAGLLQAVASGAGLAGWHGGLCDAFRDAPDYQFMTGGQWVAHPGGSDREYLVEIAPGREADPIVAGLSAFSICSEQYYLHVDPSNEVLAVTRFVDPPGAAWVDGCVMPVVWQRRYGEGRVFYSSLGHVAADFAVPEVATILRRGLIWAAR
jgi:type 1 glutamine amidotransferase